MNQKTLQFFLSCLVATALAAAAAAESIQEQLARTPAKLVYEAYVNDNWEIFSMAADGSQARNLTNTPGQHEMYPQASPDGSMLAFVVDTGSGRKTVRSVWVMDIDGGKRRKIADYARQPFWSPDGKTIAYLPQEYKKFNVVDYFTKGIVYHDLATGMQRPHPNSDKIRHLYNPGFSPDGKWIVATVHAGMGYKHAILLIEAEGNRMINLKIPGCRPVFSPDGKQLAWGPGDHEIAVADIHWESDPPSMGKRRFRILDKPDKIYHVDWAPSGKILTISRGPNGEGDPTKPGTFEAACEIVGVYADGWNIVAVSVQQGETVDLRKPPAGRFLPLTRDGHSHKESDWVSVRK